jgi:putative aldouronate transport system substrate-binding protein
VLEDNFEATWEEYVEEYNKLDVKAYEEKMTEVVKERIEASK